MRIILLKDVKKIGKENDIVEVKSGYARNFLIPKGLAEKATPQKIKKVKARKKMEKEEEKEDLQKIQQLASKIDGFEVVVPVKTGDEGQIYNSVNKVKIASQLKENGFDVKKTQIQLEKPIKEIGEFPVKISFNHNLEAEITIVVEKEE